MPYVKKEQRKYIYDSDMNTINMGFIEDGGCLQYAIAVMVKELLATYPDNYGSREMIMGALAGAQMEFYRRHVAPYEDKKIEENGDI